MGPRTIEEELEAEMGPGPSLECERGQRDRSTGMDEAEGV